VHENDSQGSQANPMLDAILVSKEGTIVSGPNTVAGFYFNNNLPGNEIALGFDGTHYLLVYTEISESHVGPLSGLFISPATGKADGAPFPIYSNAISYLHDEPSIAFDGTNYLLVWVEESSSPPGLWATRVSQSGTVLDSSPLILMNVPAGARSSAQCCSLAPTVSFDGSNFLVAYRDVRTAAPNYFDATISAASK